MFDQKLVAEFGTKYAGLVLLDGLQDRFSFRTVQPFWSPGFALWDEHLRTNGNAVREFLAAHREYFRFNRMEHVSFLKGEPTNPETRTKLRELDLKRCALEKPAIELSDDLEGGCVDVVRGWECAAVLLRSSMDVEDDSNNPYAGQFESRGNSVHIITETDFKFFSDFYVVNAYVIAKEDLPEDIRLNFIAQPYVKFEAGGVVFSRLPGTDITSIEASSRGPNSVTTGGSADIYDVRSGELIRVDARNDYHILTGDETPDKIVHGRNVCLTEEEALRVADLASRIEKHVGFPVDLEFGFKQGDLYLLQIRQIPDRNIESIFRPSGEAVLESNICLQPGTFKGVILELPNDYRTLPKTLRHFEATHPDTRYFVTGKVTPFTELFAEYSQAFPNSAGVIVTDHGGARMSHAAIQMRIAGTMFLGFKNRPAGMDELLSETIDVEGTKIRYSKPIIAQSDGYRGAVYKVEDNS